MSSELDSFRERLEEAHSFPTRYTFKFVVPADKEDEVAALFGQHAIQVRPSKKGNYVSVTAWVEMESADAVIEVYERASKIDKIIAL